MTTDRTPRVPGRSGLSGMSGMPGLSDMMAVGDAPASRTPDDDGVDRLFAAWARLGVAFATAPAAVTPDIERLILETVRHGRAHSRLLVMAATWLRAFGTLVARHRLARLAMAELGDSERAVLGWLLDESEARHSGRAGGAEGAAEMTSGAESAEGREGTSRGRFSQVRAACRPAARTQPVFRVHERHPALHDRLTLATSATARRWNLLAEPLVPKLDALRAAGWVLERNPALATRALLEGDLRASILAALAEDPGAGDSELELARRCGASRASVHDSLTRLERAGLVARTRVGRRREIRAQGS